MTGLATALSAAASLWCDPEFRKEAVQATLAAPNQFTREALAFAIDQQMSQVTRSAVKNWVAGRRPDRRCRIGVINAGNVPLAGLQDLLAVLLCDHAYVGVRSRKSPYLLPAFVQTVRSRKSEIRAEFIKREEVWQHIDALIATGSDAAMAHISAMAQDRGIPLEHCLFRANRYGIAILDGEETVSEWDRLAQDMLLHEGMGCRSVALIFSPAGFSLDMCVASAARVRKKFPVHPATPGRLAMQKAYLFALNQHHVYGDGLEFLISTGEPEVQAPGHVRWVEYTNRNELIRMVNTLLPRLQCIVSRDGFSGELPEKWNVQPLGTTQRPKIDWQPDGRDTIDFLCSL